MMGARARSLSGGPIAPVGGGPGWLEHQSRHDPRSPRRRHRHLRSPAAYPDVCHPLPLTTLQLTHRSARRPEAAPPFAVDHRSIRPMTTTRLGSVLAPQLTEFVQVLLGLICMGTSSGYGLKRAFSTTPLGVYQPSSGALYPALARLAGKGLIQRQRPAEPAEPGRRRYVYDATPEGRTANMTWIRMPVRPETVSRDLGLHLLRFVMMETLLSKDEVLGWLQDLMEALRSSSATSNATACLPPSHAILALDHGIAVQRASLAWARGTWEMIAISPTRAQGALRGRRRARRRRASFAEGPVCRVTGVTCTSQAFEQLDQGRPVRVPSQPSAVDL